MSKLQDIRELAQEHATSVSSSPRDWMGYMDTAARLYRYPFTDQLLIHAQHPQATACASLELWNEKMFRWVNRGARGIALLDENGHNTRLRYVFDISDTHMVAGGRSPYLWQMQEHQQEEILTHLAEAYGLEEKDTGTLSDALMAVAREMSQTVWKNIWTAWNMQRKERIWKIWMKLRSAVISASLQRTVYITCFADGVVWNRWSFWKKRILCILPIITGCLY